MINFRPVILCGGAGKRLWPLSRESYPKQFAKLVYEDETLFQSTLRRAAAAGGINPVLMSANRYRFVVGEQLEQANIQCAQQLIEPTSRNTAASIAAAAYLINQESDDIMVVFPSDHHIEDESAFSSALKKAIQAAQDNQIVTLGVVPKLPETSYGYIEIAKDIDSVDETTPFLSFVEKPDQEGAKRLFKNKKHFWNSGIFIFKASQILKAFQMHDPETLSAVSMAVELGKKDLDFFRLDTKYDSARDISFDHAIMEHVEGLVVPMDCGWNDMGGWRTVWQESQQNDQGNVTKGNTTLIECQNSLIRNESNKMQVVSVGLDNIAVVVMHDGVLVSHLDKVQLVGDAVSQMRSEGVWQADKFPQSFRPWGWFETLIKNTRFHVKTILVEPGKKLSLQSHIHRAEHWIVVEGSAKVTIDDEIKIISENESVYVPLGAKHRLENPGKVDLKLIEVQTGAYLEEDDIIRYEDVYNREE